VFLWIVINLSDKRFSELVFLVQKEMLIAEHLFMACLQIGHGKMIIGYDSQINRFTHIYYIEIINMYSNN
jgi:hypothetical protein